jgi:cytidylate kinase
LHGHRPLIIGLSGQLGSGKSTLARSLAEALSGKTAAFGDYVRSLAKQNGASVERPSLQQIGETAVRHDPSAFVHAFLKWANPTLESPFVIDGVRHVDVDTLLRAWATSKDADYLAILVMAPDELRADRRTGGKLNTLAELDSHPVERESATKLPVMADIKVGNDQDIGQLTMMISERLEALRAEH